MSQEEKNLSDTEIFKLKRKWQIALRRYILEQKAVPDYARYFGLPIYLFREWIEMQFDKDINWENFGKKWQFDHIIPVTYFDFNKEEDLILCWNFINIRIGRILDNRVPTNRIDALSAKSYFKFLYSKTEYFVCKQMVDKIEALESSLFETSNQLETFISIHSERLEHLRDFTREDFERVNWGLTIEDILAENKLLSKFGK